MKIASLRELNALPLILGPGFPLARYLLVFDPETNKLFGVFYREGKTRYGIDITDLTLSSQGWVVKNPAAITEPDEKIPFWQTLLRDSFLLDLPIYTESEVFLGEVADAMFDTDQFYLISIVSTSRAIIDRDRIVSITEKRVTVRDSNKPKVFTDRVAQALPAQTAAYTPSQMDSK